jgi:hypothetical protein
MSFVQARVILPAVPPDPNDNRVRRELSMEQLGIVRSIRASNPFVGPALGALTRSLLGGGIRIRNGKKDHELVPSVQLIVDTAWTQFCKQLIQDIVTYGFSIVALDTQRQMPYTLEPLQWFKSISVASNEYGMERVYELKLAESKRDDAKSLNLLEGDAKAGSSSSPATAPPIVIVEQHPPDAEGDLTSPCRTLIGLDALVGTLLSCQVTVATRNARPALVTTTDEKSPEQSQTARDIGAAGETSIQQRSRSQLDHVHHVEASAANAERLRAVNRLHAAQDIELGRAILASEFAGQGAMQILHALPADGDGQALKNTPLLRNPMTGGAEWPVQVGAQQYEGAIVPLPPNTSLENVPPAQGADSYLVKLLELVRDVTYANIGVPPHLWGSTSSSVASNMVVLTTFADTKNALKELLQHVIQMVFTVLFGSNELKAEHDSQLRRARARLARGVLQTPKGVRKRKATEAELDEQKAEDEADRVSALQATQVHVSLPGILDMEMIGSLQDRGLMAFDKVAQYTAAYLGIPREDLATEHMDPETGQTTKAAQEATQQHEKDMLKTKASMSVRSPPKGGVGKAPPKKKPKTATQGTH